MWATTRKAVKELTEIEWEVLTGKKEIKVSPHADDHLSTAQRKVFKEEDLREMVAREQPRKVYLQENGRYRAYFRKADGFRELIIDASAQGKIIIVSFMDPKELPRVQLD